MHCTGLGPFGLPPFPQPCPRPAEFYVWPKCEPQITMYACLCADHLAALQVLRQVYQTTNIATGEVTFPTGRIANG